MHNPIQRDCLATLTHNSTSRITHECEENTMNTNTKMTVSESNNEHQNNSPTASEHPESNNSEFSIITNIVLDRDFQWPEVLKLITSLLNLC